MKFITGVNYWPRNKGLAMWRDFDIQEIASDMETIAGLGMNSVRVFLRWSDFQPAPNLIDEAMMDRFEQVLDAARKAGIGVIPTFFCGHMSGENWDVPWRGGRDPYTDPEMLRAQALQACHFARRYRGDERIICWDLANEQDVFVKPQDRHSGWFWTRFLTAELKLNDPGHPVTLGTHISSLWEDCGFWPQDLAESLDFLCMHAYPLYSDACPERMDGVRSTYFVPFCAALTRALGRGADVLFEEFGATSQMCAEDVTERYYLTTLYALLAEGVTGAMGWCYGDFSVGDQLPYETTPYEVGFGLVDRVGRPKGAGRAMAEFCKVLDMAGGEVMQKAEVGAAVVVQRRYYQNYDPDVTPARNFRALFNSYVLARRSGLSPEVVTFDDDLDGFKVLFVPSVPRRGAINTSDWRRLAKFVEDGGTLYMSYDGVALEGMGDVFGIDVRYPVNEGEGTLLRLCRPETVDNPEADRTLPVSNRTGRRMIAEPENAMALWSRDDASPAVTAAKFGHGRAVFCDFPLELSLSYEPDAYQRGVYEEIYKDAVSLSKWQEPAWTDSPDASATVLKSKGDDRWLVLVNFSHEPRNVAVWWPGATSVTAIATGEEFRCDSEGRFRVSLRSNEGAMFC